MKEGVQIVLDDVRIIPKQFDVQMYSLRSDVDVNTDIDLNSEEDENCIRNADFELGNSRNWVRIIKKNHYFYKSKKLKVQEN